MNYKALFYTLLFGIIVFALAVALGMKYNLVRFLQSEPVAEEVAEESGLPTPPGQEIKADQQSADSKKALKEKVKGFELIEEENITGSTEELIRNDCIRASRRAGVTDENIFAVVNKCVEMSRQEQNDQQAFPIEDPTQGNGMENSGDAIPQPNDEDSLELTRKACRIVADEEQGLSVEERNKVVEQCVKANMDSN